MGETWIVLGLGFGDEGKGSIVDSLVRKTGAKTVVRFNGGAQAAHRVVHGATAHVFSQFGSGTLAGARTFLSQDVLVNPSALLNEAATLINERGISDALDRIYVDGNALVTTPFHVAANRIREAARADAGSRHGSCGMGIGETVADDISGTRLRVRELSSLDLAARLRDMRLRKLRQLDADGFIRGDSADWQTLTSDTYADLVAERWWKWARTAHIVDADWLRREMANGGDTVFEGAQGVLLDQDYGFHPYTTWSKTTFENADALLASVGRGAPVKRLGVMRTYQTRHGAGPFPTANSEWKRHQDTCNPYNQWQQQFRTGPLDYVLTRYAIDVCGWLDHLAVTHADVDTPPPCVEYRHGGRTITRLPVVPPSFHRSDAEHIAWQERLTAIMREVVPVYGPPGSIDDVERQLGVPVAVSSYGEDSREKYWRLK